MLILSTPVFTSDKRLTPIFTVPLSAIALCSDALPTTDNRVCRFVGTLSAIAPTSGKYPRKQGAKPLSEVQVGGARKR